MPNRSKAPTCRPQPPMPVTVAEDAFHRPQFVTYLGEELKVDSIDQQSQDDAEPWEHKSELIASFSYKTRWRTITPTTSYALPRLYFWTSWVSTALAATPTVGILDRAGILPRTPHLYLRSPRDARILYAVPVDSRNGKRFVWWCNH